LSKDFLNIVKTYKVTVAIIVINLVVFLTYAFDDLSFYNLVQLGSNFAPYTLSNQPYRLFSSMFLHASWIHIAMNMYSLFVIGTSLEREVGSKKFLEVYFFSGLFI
jgi:rhomboid protease GluP